MKIYTKTGDFGETSLVGGTRLLKSHIKIEAYGAVDELNSHIGLLLSYEEDEIRKKWLYSIQNQLFNLGSMLATEPDFQAKLVIVSLEEVIQLEQWIDEMTANLEPIRFFILPSGSLSISQAHVARTVSRRAERAIIRLNEIEKVNPVAIQYLNRLSDFLFTLARMWHFVQKLEEIPWKKT